MQLNNCNLLKRLQRAWHAFCDNQGPNPNDQKVAEHSNVKHCSQTLSGSDTQYVSNNDLSSLEKSLQYITSEIYSMQKELKCISSIVNRLESQVTPQPAIHEPSESEVDVASPLVSQRSVNAEGWFSAPEQDATGVYFKQLLKNRNNEVRFEAMKLDDSGDKVTFQPCINVDSLLSSDILERAVKYDGSVSKSKASRFEIVALGVALRQEDGSWTILEPAVIKLF
ncbi:hypothetical protein [uncultured Porphyromonas sp.]|uniref:hypothetical protein n=1 Tax=uncultured Porphyromonas sp. TaxID=159274 RepID=UPI0025991BD2|nr:hypothetical protein [uncultured Porphyromonas sp.]